jgi:hypothetical protein
MRFGFIAHPGFKSPSLRSDLGFCVSHPVAIDTATEWPGMTAYYFKHDFVGYIYQRTKPRNGETVTTPSGL